MGAVLITLCVLAFIVKGGVVDAITAKKGDTPPSLEKWRGRREDAQRGKDKARQVGGKARTALSGSGKARKEPGAVRQYGQALKLNATEMAVEKARDRHNRRLAWFRDTADDRDEAWRGKQTKKLNKQRRKTEDYAYRHGLRDSDPAQTTGGQAPDPQATELADAADADELHEPADTADTPAADTEPPATPSPTEGPTGSEDSDRMAAAFGTTATAATSSETTTPTGGATVYDTAAQQLHEHADEIEAYRQELTVFGDGLTGRGWGTGVTGRIGDMDGDLAAASAQLRDLAETIRAQGDAVKNAYEAHPDVPDLINA